MQSCRVEITSLISTKPNNIITTYINYKDLLGVIQELDFQMQHPQACS